MPSGNEKEAMTIIADEGGQTNVTKVAKGMGLGRDYTSIILESLGRADYLDMTRGGKVRLNPKGYRAIRREVESAKAEWNDEELFESHGIRLVNFPMQPVQKSAEKKPPGEKSPDEKSPDSAAPGDWRRYYVEATADS